MQSSEIVEQLRPNNIQRARWAFSARRLWNRLLTSNYGAFDRFFEKTRDVASVSKSPSRTATFRLHPWKRHLIAFCST